MAATASSFTLIGENNLGLKIEQFEARAEAAGSPRNGIFLVLFGSLHNISGERKCIYARDVRLILDGIDYAPQGDAMSAVQSTLTPYRDYIGPVAGQCIGAGAGALTFAVFDVPLQSNAAALRMFDRTTDIAVTWQQQAIALAATRDAPPPTATITDTPQPVVNATLINADINQKLESAYAQVAGVLSVSAVNTIGVQPPIVYSEIVVKPGYNTTETADALRQVAYTLLAAASMEFSTILDDGVEAVEYTWSNQTTSWRTTRLGMTAVGGITPEPELMLTAQPEIYYVSSAANLRTCPQRDCEVIIQLSGGTALVVDAFINGESVSAGNAVWYRVQYNGREAFVYSDLVTRNTPAPVVQPPSPPISTIPPAAPLPAFTCDCSKSCEAMVSCEEAYFQLRQCGCSKRDRNNDGVPCESRCGG